MQFSRIVLLGFGAEVAKMVLGVIDAADEGYLLVHHRYLAMHAAQRVDTKAEHSGARIENMETHPGFSKAGYEGVVQAIGAVAIHGKINLDAATRCVNQYLA